MFSVYFSFLFILFIFYYHNSAHPAKKSSSAYLPHFIPFCAPSTLFFGLILLLRHFPSPPVARRLLPHLLPKTPLLDAVSLSHSVVSSLRHPRRALLLTLPLSLSPVLRIPSFPPSRRYSAIIKLTAPLSSSSLPIIIIIIIIIFLLSLNFHHRPVSYSTSATTCLTIHPSIRFFGPSSLPLVCVDVLASTCPAADTHSPHLANTFCVSAHPLSHPGSNVSIQRPFKLPFLGLRTRHLFTLSACQSSDILFWTHSTICLFGTGCFRRNRLLDHHHRIPIVAPILSIQYFVTACSTQGSTYTQSFFFPVCVVQQRIRLPDSLLVAFNTPAISPALPVATWSLRSHPGPSAVSVISRTPFVCLVPPTLPLISIQSRSPRNHLLVSDPSSALPAIVQQSFPSQTIVTARLLQHPLVLPSIRLIEAPSALQLPFHHRRASLNSCRQLLRSTVLEQNNVVS